MESKIKVTSFEQQVSPYLAKIVKYGSLTIVLVNPEEFNKSGYVSVIYSNDPKYSLGKILEVGTADLVIFHGEITLTN